MTEKYLSSAQMHENWIRVEAMNMTLRRNHKAPIESSITEAKKIEAYLLGHKKAAVLRIRKKGTPR